MQKKKRTALEVMVDAVARSTGSDSISGKKMPTRRYGALNGQRTSRIRSRPTRYWIRFPSLFPPKAENGQAVRPSLRGAVNTGMAANALTKYLNVKSGRLLDEYHVRYENRAKHSGRQVKLTYTAIDNVEYEVIE